VVRFQTYIHTLKPYRLHLVLLSEFIVHKRSPYIGAKGEKDFILFQCGTSPYYYSLTGEDACNLIMSENVSRSDIFVNHLLMNEVIVNFNVFGAGMVNRIGG
jgi:hypothetical protein